jgi:1-deoxy-D-xylulose-5-phosphate reductoisomerase
MKDLIILGATGSIGTQTLDIVRQYKDEYRVIAMSVGRDLELSMKIIEEFKPRQVCCRKIDDAISLSEKFPDIEYSYGDEGLIKTATFDVDNKNVLLVVALVGSVGLLPTVKAIEIGRNIALANKETLVTAGEIVMKLAKENNVTIFPIDSEHSAIYQAILGEKHSEIEKIIITASGGSLRDYSALELKNVTIKEVLNHPNWKMGAKITVDSSTMMNKAFEVIEAHHLFNVPYDKIETIIHRESIVHSLVEFKDSSVKAQLANSDMHIPILYALSYPNRLKYENKLSLLGKNLTFSEMDFDRYPCLKLAYEAMNKGNIYPTVLNASNDIAVTLFLEGIINYSQIEEIIRDALSETVEVSELTIDVILEVEKEVRFKIIKKYERGF